MKVYAITDIGRMRPINEDSYYLPLEGERFCAVADGMGGHNAGEVASALAVQVFSRSMRDVERIMSKKFLCMDVGGTNTRVGIVNDEFIELGKADVEGAMAPMLSVKSDDDPDMAYFVEQYKALRDGKAPSSLDMQCYDSVGMLLTAIQNIGGENDHAAIRDQLATMTYEGVCGTIQFDENRDATKEYVPLIVKDGAWVPYEG